MQATKIFANLRVADIEAAKVFYTNYLGLTNEEFNMGWVTRYSSADAGARLQLVTGDATAAEDSVISVCTDDIDAAYAEAQQLGYDIVHPTDHRSLGSATGFRPGSRRECHQHRRPSRLKFDVLDVCGRGYNGDYDHVRETQFHETAGYRWSCCCSDCRDARGGR
jgi:predicted enzyme related to lactoylglutathione lyase